MPGIKFNQVVNKEPASDLRLILAVQTELLPPDLLVTAFHKYPGYSALNVMREAGLWFGPRNLLEESPSFRQIIPYTVLVSQKDGGIKVLAYRRTEKGGEARLHGKVSIGVGGHIDITDVNPEASKAHTQGKFDLEQTLREATYREIREELGELEEYVSYRKLAGLLVDQDNAVGRVHLGAVNIWYMTDRFSVADHTIIEDALKDVGFYTPEQLLAEPGLEAWSRILLENVGAWA